MVLTRFFSLKTIINDSYRKNPDLHVLSEDEIKDLQKCLLAIYQNIFNVCEKYEIKPFLQGGTLLGKIRHNGFIPWDDDLDLGMIRSDYEKFKDIFQEELGEHYLLRGPGCPQGATNRFIQVFKKNTYYKTVGMPEIVPHHVYIDIFPIDYVPNQKWKQFLYGNWCDILMAVASCVEFKETFNKEMRAFMQRTWIGKMNMYLRLSLGNVFSVLSLHTWYKIIDSTLKKVKLSDYCTSGTGRKHYLGEILSVEAFFPLQRSEFEGCFAWIPNQSELYLKNLYGDYMKIPDKKDREQHFIEKLRIEAEAEVIL